MIILKEQLVRLASGGLIGSRQSIKDWAKDSVLKGTYFHYSPERDKIMQQGFMLGARSHYDGIYFAYDADWSKPCGNGTAPIEVMLNVPREQYIDFGKPTQMQSTYMQEWEESQIDEDDEFYEPPEFGQPGTIGPFMKKYGLLVWSDGTQIGVMSPKVIGIIE